MAVALNSIHLYDVATGEERLRIDRRATDPRFTDGGKTLVAAVEGAIHRWDTATGTSLMPETEDNAVEQIFVTPDGSRVVTRDQDGHGHRHGRYRLRLDLDRHEVTLRRRPLDTYPTSHGCEG